MEGSKAGLLEDIGAGSSTCGAYVRSCEQRPGPKTCRPHALESWRRIGGCRPINAIGQGTCELTSDMTFVVSSPDSIDRHK